VLYGAVTTLVLCLLWWFPSKKPKAGGSDWDAVEATPAAVNRWDATPGAGLGSATPGPNSWDATPGHAAAGGSRWDATPGAGGGGVDATPSTRRNRWDETPAAVRELASQPTHAAGLPQLLHSSCLQATDGAARHSSGCYQQQALLL